MHDAGTCREVGCLRLSKARQTRSPAPMRMHTYVDWRRLSSHITVPWAHYRFPGGALPGVPTQQN
eukprot:365709-Chlamydomonas_euryale.AAC.6